MADYQDFDGAHYLGAPPGWNDDQGNPPCGALPVRLGKTGNAPCLSSFWKPTPEELKALNEGACIRLDVLSTAHPPVYVGAGYVTEGDL